MTGPELQERVLLVGGIPHPIGGVTNHVWRLAMKLRPYGCGVVDRFPSDAKYELPGVNFRTSPKSLGPRLGWLLGQVAASRAHAVHFHFSTADRLTLMGPFLLRAAKGKRTILTLHAGDLASRYAAAGSWRRRSIRTVLGSFDALIALSDQHAAFYRELGLDEGAVIQASSYIAPAEDIAPGAPMRSRFDSVRKSAELLIVASGYPSRAYRHEHAIRLVKSLRKEHDAHLALCLYGPAESPEYRAGLVDRKEDGGYIHTFTDLESRDFLALLSLADIYVRPFIDDSCGLAVCEAISMAVPAIATDCCNRYPGTVVYPTDQYDALEMKTRQTIERLATAKQELKQMIHQDSFAQITKAYGDIDIAGTVKSSDRLDFDHV